MAQDAFRINIARKKPCWSDPFSKTPDPFQGLLQCESANTLAGLSPFASLSDRRLRRLFFSPTLIASSPVDFFPTYARFVHDIRLILLLHDIGSSQGALSLYHPGCCSPFFCSRRSVELDLGEKPSLHPSSAVSRRVYTDNSHQIISTARELAWPHCQPARWLSFLP